MQIRISAERIENAGFTIEHWEYRDKSASLIFVLTDRNKIPMPKREDLEKFVSRAEAEMLIEQYHDSVIKQMLAKVFVIGS